jgi:peptide/nickel transport system ATP-binding protein/oligopeptide transport system ATP-binding protein
MSSENNILLSVKDLQTEFRTDQGVAKAVDRVSFDIRSGKTLAVVGESGCGKSVTALSILRLIPEPPGKIVGGDISFEGRDLLRLSRKEMRGIRGNDITMIFQEPMTSMNPVFRVGGQIAAAIRLHRGVSKARARVQTLNLLEKVGISSAEQRLDDYPHQMSGGMLQRVMIAMALACEPKLLIADEPTTALDVTIQAQILDLLTALQKETGMAILLITHDLGVVAETADEVVVMYAGRKVEQAPVKELFAAPQHPYTRGLFASLPNILEKKRRLYTIEGNVPAATHFPEGCHFHPRCPYAMEICKKETPVYDAVGEEHHVACWLHDKPAMDKLNRSTGIPKEAKA